MALPVNIDDLVNHRKVEWERIEYDQPRVLTLGDAAFAFIRKDMKRHIRNTSPCRLDGACMTERAFA